MTVKFRFGVVALEFKVEFKKFDAHQFKSSPRIRNGALRTIHFKWPLKFLD